MQRLGCKLGFTGCMVLGLELLCTNRKSVLWVVGTTKIGEGSAIVDAAVGGKELVGLALFNVLDTISGARVGETIL